MSARPLLIGAVAIVAFAVGAIVARGWQGRLSEAPDHATEFVPPHALPTIALLDQDGQPLDAAFFTRGWTLVFFGFTRCPDICPTTLADIAQAVKSLGADAERVQVLMVSVDPERDTPEALAKYVTAFDPRFIALRGDLEATKKVAGEFKIFFEKAKSGDSYTVNHSAQSYVIDPQGRLRLLVRHDRIGSDLGPDLRTILQGA